MFFWDREYMQTRGGGGHGCTVEGLGGSCTVEEFSVRLVFEAAVGGIGWENENNSMRPYRECDGVQFGQGMLGWI